MVVVDHHELGAELPPAVAIVNPNRQDDLSGLGHLAAVGVTFMVVIAVNRLLRTRGWYGAGRAEPDLLQWLDLVALGTVCDVVPLVGINRAFVSKGLMTLARRGNRGIAALADVARLGGPVAPYHLGFLIGPRINAGGRIGDASLGARLLTSDDPAECGQLAAELDRLNGERQAMEAAMLEEAMAEADAEIGTGEGPAVLVTGSPRWHAGVVGLIASRLKDRYQRPAIAIAFTPNGIGTGSGRSIVGIDLGLAVRTAVERGILLKGGGHAMAAGLTVEQARLGDLRAFLVETLAERVWATTESHGLAIDAALSARGATTDLIEAVDKAGPFGAGHPEPVYVFPSHQIELRRYGRQRPHPPDACFRRWREHQGDGVPRRRLAARRGATGGPRPQSPFRGIAVGRPLPGPPAAQPAPDRRRYAGLASIIPGCRDVILVLEQAALEEHEIIVAAAACAGKFAADARTRMIDRAVTRLLVEELAHRAVVLVLLVTEDARLAVLRGLGELRPRLLGIDAEVFGEAFDVEIGRADLGIRAAVRGTLHAIE